MRICGAYLQAVHLPVISYRLVAERNIGYVGFVYLPIQNKILSARYGIVSVAYRAYDRPVQSAVYRRIAQ